MKWILALLLMVQLTPSNYSEAERTLPAISASGLFESSDVLNLTLSGSLNATFKDRQDNPQYHPASLSYTNADSTKVSIPIEIKTRGHFRKTLGNCQYPPLMLHFSKERTPAESPFAGQEKL